MNDDELAALYALAFPNDANPWRRAHIHALRHDKTGHIFTTANAALLGRIMGEEAEILSVFVHPNWRRNQEAQKLCQVFFNACNQEGVREIFLEVSKENKAALALYAKLGFRHVGLRKNYYKRKDGSREDALILRVTL